MLRNILKYSFIAFAFIMLMSSCSTYEKFKVTAPTGTILLTPNDATNQKKVDIEGEFIDFSIPSNSYCGFVMFLDETTGLQGPYGLNLKKNSHSGEKFTLGMSYALASSGLTGTLAGLLGICTGESDNPYMLTTLYAGLGAGALSGILGGVSDTRLSQLTHKYQFTYQKKQYVEIGQLTTTLLHPDPEKEFTAEPLKRPNEIQPATETKNSPNTAAGSKTNRTKPDYANKISGTYNGSGKLLYGNKTEENYPDISIVIKRVDNKHVTVNILESGEEFFSEPLIYTIKENSKDNYYLNIDNIADATITINNSGICTFTHKQVNIDGEIYTLSITAAKGQNPLSFPMNKNNFK